MLSKVKEILKNETAKKGFLLELLTGNTIIKDGKPLAFISTEYIEVDNEINFYTQCWNEGYDARIESVIEGKAVKVNFEKTLEEATMQEKILAVLTYNEKSKKGFILDLLTETTKIDIENEEIYIDNELSECTLEDVYGEDITLEDMAVNYEDIYEDFIIYGQNYESNYNELKEILELV